MSDSSEDEFQPYGDDDFDSTDGEEELLPSEDELSSDEDEDVGPSIGKKLERFKIETQKNEMASDIEDEDEEGYLPNSQAWGKDKRQFYHTDFVDKDFRNIQEKDKNLAKYEEEEALAIQKRLLESVNEADLGLELLTGPSKPDNKKPAPKTDTLTKRKNIELDISSMSEKEKLSIVKQDSPELELLISDFKKYSKEVSTYLNPAIEKLTQSKAPSSSGLEFLRIRRTLLLNYCTNVSFYFTLKSSHEKDIIKNHPVIKQLFIYKKFISELDATLERSDLSSEIKHVLKQDVKNIKFIKRAVAPATKATSITIDDKIEPKVESDEYSAFDEDMEDDEEGKRAITYQMEKNKGLIPKRKREQRNPRVRYRKKFESAVVRRKGQVREPRKEIKKYGGELTGINVKSVKSVKFR